LLQRSCFSALQHLSFAVLQVLASAGAKKSRQERRQARKASREEARQARDGGPVGPQGSSRDDAIKRAIGSQFADMHSAAAAAADGVDAGTSSSSSSGSEEGGQAGAQQRVDADAAAAGGSDGTEQQVDGAAASPPAASAGSDADEDEDAVAKELAAAKDEAERAEISALLAEENVAELPYEGGDAAAALLKELDSLTGCPRADDVLLYAVPVCGPYQALANYKLKVKLTPGTLKKGKAAKQALELLVRGGDVLQRERDLMRAVPDAELVSCMVGTVKISAPGLQQLKVTSKKAKKAAAQSRNAS
jgi:hypothetical protein